jgi:hypothetical protein
MFNCYGLSVNIFPNKKQWKDWSLPSKLSALSFYLAVVAIIVTAVPTFFNIVFMFTASSSIIDVREPILNESFLNKKKVKNAMDSSVGENKSLSQHPRNINIERASSIELLDGYEHYYTGYLRNWIEDTEVVECLKGSNMELNGTTCIGLTDKYYEYANKYHDKDTEFREFLSEMFREKKTFFLQVNYPIAQLHIEEGEFDERFIVGLGPNRYFHIRLFTSEPTWGDIHFIDNDNSIGFSTMDSYNFNIAIQVPSDDNQDGFYQFNVPCKDRNDVKLTGFYRISFISRNQGSEQYVAYLVDIDKDLAFRTHTKFYKQSVCY